MFRVLGFEIPPSGSWSLASGKYLPLTGFWPAESSEKPAAYLSLAFEPLNPEPLNRVKKVSIDLWVYSG